TGPLVQPEWWGHGDGDDLGAPLTAARHSREDPPEGGGWSPLDDRDTSRHPSGPLPPMPPGVWDRLRARTAAPVDDAATVAQPLVPGGPPAPDGRDPVRDRADQLSDEETEAHVVDPRAWEDRTGGLDVIGAHVAEEAPRRRGRRARREAEAEAARQAQQDAVDAPGTDAYATDAYAAQGHGPDDDVEHLDHDLLHDDLERDLAHEVLDADGLVHDEHFGEDIPVKPYDPRSARTRRRRPLAVLVSLLALGGLVAGIVLGGQQLLTLIDPTSRDHTGQGTGTVEIRVQDGDTLSDIARTLVDAGVIASTGPFITAAEADAASVGIQPGVYALRRQMSGQAALDLMLDPAARQLSRVTLPEGLTVQRTLARLAEATGRPEAEFVAAAADPAALGLPAYANGQLEGFLFPATYDFEPDTSPTEMLREMVAKFTEVAGRLQLEQRAAALGRTPLEVVSIASMVESETRLDAERPDVAQVIYNRLGAGVALGVDATLAYGLQKNGNDLTVSDLQTDSPYNTRTRTGLPPTPISAPGEASLEAALSPTTGNLLYYVLQSSDGSHFFTGDYAEFEAARQRCADADLGCGG
ncbi:MAG: endolytic transglycosylase MltG, partial [Actinomycetes bacterium]